MSLLRAAIRGPTLARGGREGKEGAMAIANITKRAVDAAKARKTDSYLVG